MPSPPFAVKRSHCLKLPGRALRGRLRLQRCKSAKQTKIEPISCVSAACSSRRKGSRASRSEVMTSATSAWYSLSAIRRAIPPISNTLTRTTCCHPDAKSWRCRLPFTAWATTMPIQSRLPTSTSNTAAIRPSTSRARLTRTVEAFRHALSTPLTSGSKTTEAEPRHTTSQVRRSKPFARWLSWGIPYWFGRPIACRNPTWAVIGTNLSIAS